MMVSTKARPADRVRCERHGSRADPEGGETMDYDPGEDTLRADDVRVRRGGEPFTE